MPKIPIYGKKIGLLFLFEYATLEQEFESKGKRKCIGKKF